MVIDPKSIVQQIEKVRPMPVSVQPPKTEKKQITDILFFAVLFVDTKTLKMLV